MEKGKCRFLDYSNREFKTEAEVNKVLSKLKDLQLKPEVTPTSESLFNHHLNPPKKPTQRTRLAPLEPWPKTLRKYHGPSRGHPKMSFNRTFVSPIPEESETENFPYEHPIPHELRGLNVDDFVATDIDWRMMTLLRPKTKLEEEYYSRLINIKKQQRKTRIEDGVTFRKAAFNVSRHPRVLRYKPRRFSRDSFGFKLDEERSVIDVKEDYCYDAYARDTSTEAGVGTKTSKDVMEYLNELDISLLDEEINQLAPHFGPSDSVKQRFRKLQSASKALTIIKTIKEAAMKRRTEEGSTSNWKSDLYETSNNGHKDSILKLPKIVVTNSEVSKSRNEGKPFELRAHQCRTRKPNFVALKTKEILFPADAKFDVKTYKL